MAVSYYQLKLFFRENMNRSIFDNVSYVDRCLKSAGVVIPHRKNLILCIIYMIRIMCMCVFVIYMDIFEMIIKETTQSGSETPVISEVDSKVRHLNSIVVFFFCWTFLSNIVRQICYHDFYYSSKAVSYSQCPHKI